MHGKCQAWDPQGKSVVCPFLPTKGMGSFSQQVPLVLLESLCTSLAAGFGPWGVLGWRRGVTSKLWSQLLLQLAFTLHKGSALWEKKRMVLVAIFIAFGFSASCQTLESTHRQKQVHLSVNKGYLFMVRINSEFWQPSVWGCLLWE